MGPQGFVGRTLTMEFVAASGDDAKKFPRLHVVEAEYASL